MSADFPSTFLELCKATATECGAGTVGTSPTDTTSQTGRLAQIVGWVNKTKVEIEQKRNDWRFMVGSFTVNTVAGTRRYAYTSCTDTDTSAAITAFREWCKNTVKVYLTSAGQGSETALQYIDYRDWHTAYNVGTQAVSTTRTYPRVFTHDNDLALLLGEYPDAVYTVSGKYMKRATPLSGDSDTPALPAEYRMLIVYGAMMKYGRYLGAPEVYTDGKANYQRMMRELIRTQTLPPLIGGPLAR